MANRFVSPQPQFFADPVTGSPLAGGFLYFYVTGTSTPLNIYTDAALTIAAANPMVLDADGFPTTSIFLQNAAYKVTLKDSNLVDIWTKDPVYASDYSTLAAVMPWNGDPNGHVAGNKGVQGALPGTSMVWDYTNRLLYLCVNTGSASTALWIAINEPADNPPIPMPQGYLTPVSGTPVISSDVISATAVYYTPLTGNTVPIYNGVAFDNTTFTELTLTLTSSQAASTLCDVYVFNNSGTVTLAVGPAWATSTGGAGSRGGPAAITKFNGVWVNSLSITGRNGANAYTIPANTGTYVGTLLIDTVAGQITCHRSVGTRRKWGVWNAYNRYPIVLQEQDPTATWTYATATYRQSRNSALNQCIAMTGLAEEELIVTFDQKLVNTGSPLARAAEIAIGVNSTTVPSDGMRGWYSSQGDSSASASVTIGMNPHASVNVAPALGIQNINSLEQGDTGMNFYGANYSLLQVIYRG